MMTYAMSSSAVSATAMAVMSWQRQRLAAPACISRQIGCGQHAAASRHVRRSVAVQAAGLVDPSAAGLRRVFVPQKMDPAKLKNVRNAEAFGPRGLLLIGMGEADVVAVRRWFADMEPGFVVSCCPAALLSEGTLRQAVSPAGDGSAAAALPEMGWQAQPADAPPVAFFSGMSGEEQVAAMEAWEEHAGLQAPAFASVTPSIMDKQLSRLLADIVRAQAQQPPPGYDPEVSAIQAAAAGAGSGGSSAAGAAAAAVASGAAAGVEQATGAAGAAGGEGELRTKLQDYVMLDGQGQAATSPMSLDALKDQIQDKVRAKRAAQAAAERQSRRADSQDETDRMRQALRTGKAGKKQQQKGRGFGG